MPRHGFAVQFAGVCTLFGYALGAPSAALAQTPGFYLMGVPPGLEHSLVNGISADGSKAVGYSNSATASTSFMWTRATGRLDLTLANSGIPDGAPVYGISPDGSTLIGSAPGPSGRFEAFRSRGPGTFESLGIFPGARVSVATAASADGSVVIGYNEAPQAAATVAFHWTAATGMQIVPGVFGAFSQASSVSADGTKTFGWSDNVFGGVDAFVWSESAGYQVLPSMSGTRTSTSAVTACSLDGLTAVGESESADVVRWHNGIVQDLGRVAGYGHAYARGTNGDGSVVVGFLDSNVTHPSGGSFIWTEASGMIALDAYLARFGVGVPTGWTLTACTAVNADATVFAGFARAPDGGHVEGWAATIPTPGVPAILGVMAVGIGVRRRRVRVTATTEGV